MGQHPLKVCRHCSVASRTEAARCPNCGKPYERRLWRWWYAIPIVVIAFAGGYFGISRLIEDEEPAGVTAEEAAAVTPGSSPADVEDQLGTPQYERGQPARRRGVSCAYYAVADEPDAVWEFCFQDDKLVTSQELGQSQGAAATLPSEP